MSPQLATQRIRMSQWAQIIHARNESGLTVRDYCDQNGLSENAYFYWLRKIRASAIEASGGQFAELKAPAEPITTDIGSAGVSIEMSGAKIHVGNGGCRSSYGPGGAEGCSMMPQTSGMYI